MTTISQDLGGVVLLPCPFCGCAMRFDSNRDWHHLTGQHEEHCLFELDDPVMTVPATDDAKAWATTVWNTRTHSSEIAGALRDAERYRWLKCNCQHMPDELGIAGQLYFGTYAWGDLDTAIDSAMQQGPGEAVRERPMRLSVALDFADNPRPYHTMQAPADTNGELYEALRVLAAAYREKGND